MLDKMADRERNFPRGLTKSQKRAARGGLSSYLFRQISNIISKNGLAEENCEILTHRVGNDITISLNYFIDNERYSTTASHAASQPSENLAVSTMTFHRKEKIPEHTHRYDQSLKSKCQYSTSLQFKKYQDKCLHRRSRKKKSKSPAKKKRDESRFSSFKSQQQSSELDTPSVQKPSHILHEHDIIVKLIIEPIQFLIFVVISIVCLFILLYDI